MSDSHPRHATSDPEPGDEADRSMPQDAASDPEPGDNADRSAAPEGTTRLQKRAGQSGVANAKTLRTVQIWTLPIVITMVVLSALAALYLSESLTPTTSLRHFPIAVVNEDTGAAGKAITNGLVSVLDKNKFDIRVLSREEARHQLDTARVYGAALIPPYFSLKLQEFGQSAASSGGARRPVITISTNPRAGAQGANIARQTLTQALARIDRKIGQQLSTQVGQQSGGVPLPEAVSRALASPIQIKTNVHRPLPDGTGNGLPAFYYSLLLLLAGFIGSVVVSRLVDSTIGYAPAGFSRVNRFAEQVNISRSRTLLIKWALIVVLALLASTVYIAIASALGMPTGHGWALWLYGVFAIIAVGITSTSVIATLGTLGLLVSMLLFVILGLPSAGATVPLEAAPSFFAWLAKVEPMHQVFLGARALLYFDGYADAGLSQAVTMTAIGLIIGLLLGAIVTRIYDRRGYQRIPDTLETANAQK